MKVIATKGIMKGKKQHKETRDEMKHAYGAKEKWPCSKGLDRFNAIRHPMRGFEIPWIIPKPF